MAVEPLQTLSAPSGFADFQYETLKLSSTKPSIRLAVLQPGTRESSIRIKLVYKAYADQPKYEALSYVWGRPDSVKSVELNGTRVEIRENLWFALVHFRNSTEERTLWIDAICINQVNLQERSEQVQLMAYIYSRAEKVLVWLGVVNATKKSLPWINAICMDLTGPEKLNEQSQFMADIYSRAKNALVWLGIMKEPRIWAKTSRHPSDSKSSVFEYLQLRALARQPY